MTFKELDALFGPTSQERVIDALKARAEPTSKKPQKKEKPLHIILPVPSSWLGDFYDAEKKPKIIICTEGAYQGEDPESWRVQVAGKLVAETLSTGEIVSLVKGVAGTKDVAEQSEFAQKLRPVLAVFMSEAHSWGYRNATLPKRPVTKPFEPPEKLSEALYSITNG